MKRTFFLGMVVFMAVFLAVACSSEDPPAIPTNDTAVGGDTDTTITDTDTDNTLPDTNITDTPVTDTDVPVTDTDAPVTDEGGTDADMPSNCNTANLGKNCKTDEECGACLICVNAKCAQGCTSNADCTAYANTTCNTKLGRCLNTAGSGGACNETNCPTGCCYAEKGFLALKCLKTPEFSKCGICKQGEVFMDGKSCVPAACKVGETKCRDYNSTEVRAKCYECKQTDYVCYDNPSCSTGSAPLLLNVKECIPAGETCTDNDICCSGQPCIQGYCY